MRTSVLFIAISLSGLMASCVGMPGDSMGGGDFRLPPVPVPVGGGYAPPAAPAQPVPMVPPLGAAGNEVTAPDPTMPMLEDPEADYEEFPEWVMAMSKSIATRRCQELAERYTQSGGTPVILLSVVQENSSRWRCNFKSEVKGYDDETDPLRDAPSDSQTW